MEHLPKVSRALIDTASTITEKSLLYLIREIQDKESTISTLAKMDRDRVKQLKVLESKNKELRDKLGAYEFNTTKLVKSERICVIHNGRFAYTMVVDNVQITIGGNAVEYFKKHYEKLGYLVILTGNGEVDYNEMDCTNCMNLGESNCGYPNFDVKCYKS